MKLTNRAEFDAKMTEIIPGETYPSEVEIKESNFLVKILQNSFFSGMYAAFYMNGKLVSQAGDHDNKRFTRQLKKDLEKAFERKAEIDIGDIRNVKSLTD